MKVETSLVINDASVVVIPDKIAAQGPQTTYEYVANTVPPRTFRKTNATGAKWVADFCSCSFLNNTDEYERLFEDKPWLSFLFPEKCIDKKDNAVTVIDLVSPEKGALKDSSTPTVTKSINIDNKAAKIRSHVQTSFALISKHLKAIEETFDVKVTPHLSNVARYPDIERKAKDLLFVLKMDPSFKLLDEEVVHGIQALEFSLNEVQKQDNSLEEFLIPAPATFGNTSAANIDATANNTDEAVKASPSLLSHFNEEDSLLSCTKDIDVVKEDDGEIISDSDIDDDFQETQQDAW